MTDNDNVFGYFRSNIKNWLIKECLESGDPQRFWWALEEVFEDLQSEVEDDPDFWEHQEFPS